MKRVVFILALMLSATAMSAQIRSVGLRGGDGLELNYQHDMGPGFLEADFGVVGGKLNPGLRLTGLYDFEFVCLPTKAGVFTVYGGPGLSLGLTGKVQPCLGVALNAGAEFSLGSLPFAIAVDLRPTIWFGGKAFSADCLIPMAALRWRF